MCAIHTPLKEARQIALDYGCYVVEQKDAQGRDLYLLFRKNPNPEKRGIFIGKRRSPAAIRAYVCTVCNFK